MNFLRLNSGKTIKLLPANRIEKNADGTAIKFHLYGYKIGLTKDLDFLQDFLKNSLQYNTIPRGEKDEN